ncbi:MAG: YjfB family protein [Clostridiaceae bacterium]
MDIGALSMIMSQSKVQESAGIAVMKMAMDTGKESATQLTEMIGDVAIDSNLGQQFDVTV